MSGQTIVNSVNWGIAVCLVVWVALWLAEQWYEARQRRNARPERRASRERWWPR